MPKSGTFDSTRTPPAWLAVVAGVSVASFAFLFALQELRNYDIWWHLRTGAWILENGRIPTSDIFSFTAAGEPWTPHYWLTDVALVSAFRVGGASALIIAIATVLATAFGVAAYSLTRRGVNPYLVALLLGFAVAIARFRFMARPHVVMFLFTAIFLHLLFAYRHTDRKRLLWLLPLTWIWANAHASFMLALVFFGCLLGDELVTWAWARGRKKTTANQPAFVATLFLGLVAVTFLTPLGFDLWGWIIDDFVLKSVSRGFEIEEHAPLRWGQYPMYWGLMIATWLSFAIAWRRTRLFHGFIVAALTLLAFASLRYVGIAAFVFACVLAINLDSLVGRLAARLSFQRRDRQALVLVPMLAVMGWLAFTRTFTDDKVYRFGIGMSESRYPTAAVDFLRDIGFQGRILNTWEYGGYLMWHLPAAVVFTDGRSLPGHMEALSKAQQMTARELATYVDQADIDAALIKRGDEPFASFFAISPSFDRVFFDDQGVVFLRKELAQQLQGSVQKFRLIRPDSYDVSYLAALARGDQAAEAEAELRAAIRISPRGFHAHFMLGFFLEAQQRKEALDAYEKAIELNSRLAYAHYHMGERAARVALAHNLPDRAIAILKQSMESDDTVDSRVLLGVALYKSKRTDEAEAAFESALEENADHVGALVHLGYIYLDKRRLEDSVRLFTRAHELAPNAHDAHYGLALATDESGNSAAAKPLWREFLARYPESAWAEVARQRLAK